MNDWNVYLIWTLIAALVLVAGSRLTFYYRDRFLEKNRQESVETSPLIEYSPTPYEEIKDEVLARKREDDNIGGAEVLVATIPTGDKEEIALIFEQVKDESALVNLALNRKVFIEEVRLITVKPDAPREFKVVVKVRNENKQDITVRIPKGQIFENKQPRSNKKKKSIVKIQNLATAVAEEINIPASSTVAIELKAFCINQGFPYPEGNFGNITIFELKDKDLWNDQYSLWNWIGEAIDKSEDGNVIIRKSP